MLTILICMGILLEEELRQWVDNGVSEDAIMLHGSGIEALFELIYTSKLPTGIDNASRRDPTVDRVYFTPIFSNLLGTDLYSHINSDFYQDAIDEFTLEFALRSSEISAEISAKPFHLSSMFGSISSEIYSEFLEFTEANYTDEEISQIDFKDLIDLLLNFGINTNINQLLGYNHQSQQRKGIIIEPNKQILELPYIMPFKDSLGIFCPDGLDKKYIKGVKLLGQIEEQAAQNYLAGNETGIGRFTVL